MPEVHLKARQPTELSKQPIRTHYLGHVTGDWLSANQGPVFPDSVGSCFSNHNIKHHSPATTMIVRRTH